MRARTTPAPRDQPGAVYLLPHANRLRFKVGWSLHPMQRVQQLPEFENRMLDLGAAEVAWFAQAQRARQVERALHRSLAPFAVAPEHRGDGRTEWFGIQGLVLARRVLGLLPASDGRAQPARLRPLGLAPDANHADWLDSLEHGALDAWSRIEDLWLRLRTLLPCELRVDGEARHLHWLELRTLQQAEALRLRSHMLDLESYEWRERGQRRSLVTLMDWDGDDLVLQLSPTQRLQRWAEGDAVEGLLRAFLARHARRRAGADRAGRPAP